MGTERGARRTELTNRAAEGGNVDDYAGRVLADRYRLPLPPSDVFELVETRAFDTYSGQEVLVRQIPLPEVVFAEGGSLWIISELVSARPLAALLAERTLSPHRAAEVAAHVLTALGALHA